MTHSAGSAVPAGPGDALTRAQACLARKQRQGSPAVDLLAAGPGACTVQSVLAGAATEGRIAELATLAGAAAAETQMPGDRAALTVEFKVNIMAHGQADALRASAQVVRAGKSITVCRVEVHGLAGGTEPLYATCLMTLMAAAT